MSGVTRETAVFHAYTGASATVRALSEPAAAAGRMSSKVLEFKGKRLTLRCGAPLARDTAVRVDIDGALLLGEVAGSESTPEATTLIVQISQVIPSVPDLTSLVRNIFGEVPVAAEARRDVAMAAVR
jgi:hypothetical protein